jgi:hypothetical protein
VGIPNFVTAVALLTAPLTAVAAPPSLGTVVRYTRPSLEHFLQNSLIRLDEAERFRVVVTQFTHSASRDSFHSRLERFLHARDGRVLDFYQMQFSITDRQTGDELYRVACQIDDWQNEQYFSIRDCFTRNAAGGTLTRQDRIGLPFYLGRQLAFWFAFYSEVEFQNATRH